MDGHGPQDQATRDDEYLARRFEEHRSHLRAVSYRMLGSLSEADDAVQEAWLRLSRADTSGVGNLGGWLTTVVGRVCLDMLRSRAARREQPLEAHPRGDAPHAGPPAHRVPDPVLSDVDGPPDPEQQALLADSVGLALMVVLDTLSPAERLAFVLHDTFGLPFEEIAPVVDRTPAAARQLASRARRRVRGAAPEPDPDLARQREVVDAFLAAARGGDLQALVSVLHPDVVLRSDTALVRGAHDVSRGASTFSPLADSVRPVLVNGAAGIVAFREGRPLSVVAFTITGGLVTALDIVNSPERLAGMDLTEFADGERVTDDASPDDTPRTQ
ncbi:sigma-70 family RNA polymerase sigma factor [Streptomyces sp. 4N509B]|uniref:sigma-70 family RNA polymerase sigma factor n=1 Tax=Streptomyces sp. 4N509B TaxID=3457413 RepID=UPI003FD503EB